MINPRRRYGGVKKDYFDTENFDRQAENILNGGLDPQIPDAIKAPNWARPTQFQYNVKNAAEVVGDPDEVVQGAEREGEMLSMYQKQTKGQLAQPLIDPRVERAQMNWQPNEIDNNQDQAQISAYEKKKKNVSFQDKFGDIFKENSQDMIDYMQLKIQDNQRYLDKLYQGL